VTGVRYLLVGIASLGGLLFGYETGVAAGALQWAKFEWSQTPDDHWLLTTGTLLGALVGALAAGRVADLVGRRDVIMATTALFTLGAFVSAIAPSAFVLLVGRLVVGVGVGAISVAAPLYIAEIAPAARRGRMICVFQLMITIGILLAYLGDEMVANKHDAWRFLLGAGAVPGLILSALALLLVESPIWLALNGDHESAMAVEARLGLEGSAQGIDTLAAMADERRPDDLSEVFSVAGRFAIFLSIGLFFVQQFVGINAMFYYSTSSLKELADNLNLDFSDAPGVMLSAVNVATTVVAIVLVDRVGRRPLLLVSLAGLAFGLVAMAVGAGGHFGGAPTLSAGGLYVFIVSFALGLGPIAWVVATEMLPIHVRGLAMGVVVASHWLFDSVSSPTGLLLGDGLSRPVLLMLFAGIAAVGFAVFRRRLPETKGMSLVAIDRHLTTIAARLKDSSGHYLVATLGTLNSLLTGYNLAITAVTLVLIAEDWRLSALEQGFLASILVVGLTVGVFIAGPLSDRFGRRYLLMSTAALFVVSAFGAALAPTLGWLLLARAAAGLAIGIAAPTAGVYVAEVAPPDIRGRLLAFKAVAYGLGAILAYCVGLAWVNVDAGWRYMFGFIAVPATIYGFALLPLPESPRWLASVGRIQAARRSLVRLVGDDADRQLEAITAERLNSAEPHGPTTGTWAQLALPANRPAVLVGVAIMFLTVFSGEDMVLFYAPTIMKRIGFADTSVSYVATLGLSVVVLVMTVISLSVVDKFGRKPMVVSGLFVLAAGMLALGALTAVDPYTSSPLVRWGQLASLAVFVGAFALAVGPIAEIVVAEIYPQAIRGPATSVAHGTRSVSAIVFSLSFPLVLQAIGLAVTVIGFAAVSTLGALYLHRALPETKGRSLEEIGGLWNRRARTCDATEMPAP
jgi:sugar porter (SP) family MFS transporter